MPKVGHGRGQVFLKGGLHAFFGLALIRTFILSAENIPHLDRAKRQHPR